MVITILIDHQAQVLAPFDDGDETKLNKSRCLIFNRSKCLQWRPRKNLNAKIDVRDVHWGDYKRRGWRVDKSIRLCTARKFKCNEFLENFLIPTKGGTRVLGFQLSIGFRESVFDGKSVENNSHT